jgi:hypothetical protein
MNKNGTVVFPSGTPGIDGIQRLIDREALG